MPPTDAIERARKIITKARGYSSLEVADIADAALDLIEAQDATIINCSVKIGPNHLSRLRHAERKFEEAIK